VSLIRYRVPFYDTDAMGIVHHANFARYLELARLRFLEEHVQRYAVFVAQGLHFAVTRLELDFLSPARFDDALEIRCWLRWVRGASLAIDYRVERDAALLARAYTQHALVDTEGRPARIPPAQRATLAGLVSPEPPPPAPPASSRARRSAS
jgi:acyl-CoA thioester hydrolase